MPPKDTSPSASTQNEVPVGETNPDQPAPSPEASGFPSASPATSDQFVAQSDSTLLTDGKNPSAPAAEESETTAEVSNTDAEEEILAADPLSELSPATLSERPAVDRVDGVTTYYVNGAFQIAAPDGTTIYHPGNGSVVTTAPNGSVTIVFPQQEAPAPAAAQPQPSQPEEAPQPEPAPERSSITSDQPAPSPEASDGDNTPAPAPAPAEPQPPQTQPASYLFFPHNDPALVTTGPVDETTFQSYGPMGPMNPDIIPQAIFDFLKGLTASESILGYIQAPNGVYVLSDDEEIALLYPPRLPPQEPQENPPQPSQPEEAPQPEPAPERSSITSDQPAPSPEASDGDNTPAPAAENSRAQLAPTNYVPAFVTITNSSASGSPTAEIPTLAAAPAISEPIAAQGAAVTPSSSSTPAQAAALPSGGVLNGEVREAIQNSYPLLIPILALPTVEQMISAIQANPDILGSLYALEADPRFSDPALRELIRTLIALFNQEQGTGEVPSETPDESQFPQPDLLAIAPSPNESQNPHQ